MAYKRRAMKKNEIPEKASKRKSPMGVWADSVLDDFWASGDEAWQITEDAYGKKIVKENAGKVAMALRNRAAIKSKNEFDGKVIVTQRKGNIYIYSEENDE